MIETLQQFALMDALVSNWDGIRVRMGTLDAALERELARLLEELRRAAVPDQIAVLVDRLLDVTDTTPASDYVRQLVSRADVSTFDTNRGVVVGGGGDRSGEALADAALSAAARTLGQAAVEADGFVPVPIFFVTNRRMHPGNAVDERYGGEWVEALSYGLAHVTIPSRHRMGRMERPVLAFESRERHVVLDALDALDARAFAAELEQSGRQRDLLIFLHGYNVTFEEAARRAAQFATDALFDGVVVLFSWPSAGATLRYLADEDSAAKSAVPLAAFLKELEGGPWTRVHIVAHSMGNRVALAGLASRANVNVPLTNVVFVAADVDTELFKQQFPALRPRAGDTARRLTSYASNSDRALWLSRWFHHTNRVGRVADEPFVTADLETIDASAVDSSLLGLNHGYFGQERSVLTDLGELLRHGRSASERQLKAVRQWWTFQA